MENEMVEMTHRDHQMRTPDGLPIVRCDDVVLLSNQRRHPPHTYAPAPHTMWCPGRNADWKEPWWLPADGVYLATTAPAEGDATAGAT
jgi:hypothetical protein